MSQGFWRKLLQRIHRDERGAVSLETILIVAAIALPILIFILKFGWPKIRDYFNQGMQNLENEGSNVTNGSGSGSGTSGSTGVN
jgi:Flp pilus assembly pilin Flp